MVDAIRFCRVGGPEVLEGCALEPGAPGPGQVRVRHRAIGVNFIDTYHRSGLYPLPLPSGLGSEAAGIVEVVGEGVRDLAPGDRIAYATGPVGAYAQARVIDARHVLRLPDGIDDETAAAILLKGLTVEYLTFRTFAVQPGMTVLWHAAAGGVGSIACQWLRARGVTVIGTAGSPAKAALAREHGCAHVLDAHADDLAQQVRALTDGRGVPVVYDAVGRDTLAASLDALAPRGLLVSFGNASGKPAPIDLLTLAAKGSLYVTRPTLFAYTATREELEAAAQRLFDALGRGHVRAHIGRRAPLTEAAAVHRALEARETVGATILLP